MKTITENINGIFLINELYIYKNLSKTFDYKEDKDESLKTAKESITDWQNEVSKYTFLNINKKSFAHFPGKRVEVKHITYTAANKREIRVFTISIDNAYILSSTSESTLSYNQTISVLNEITRRGISEYINHYKPLYINSLNAEIEHNKNIITEINNFINKETEVKSLENLNFRLSITNSDIKKFQHLLNAWNNIVENQPSQEELIIASDLLENL